MYNDWYDIFEKNARSSLFAALLLYFDPLINWPFERLNQWAKEDTAEYHTIFLF